jgi:hypothetical protein
VKNSWHTELTRCSMRTKQQTYAGDMFLISSCCFPVPRCAAFLPSFNGKREKLSKYVALSNSRENVCNPPSLGLLRRICLLSIHTGITRPDAFYWLLVGYRLLTNKVKRCCNANNIGWSHIEGWICNAQLQNDVKGPRGNILYEAGRKYKGRVLDTQGVGFNWRSGFRPRRLADKYGIDLLIELCCSKIVSALSAATLIDSVRVLRNSSNETMAQAMKDIEDKVAADPKLSSAALRHL